jgi:hypothetical protein
MPDPARLLKTLYKALAAIQGTPGRKGRIVTPREATEVLVGGDLHGNLENFQRLMILADLANQPHRHLVLQEAIHGPFHYPEGGDKSHQLLDLLAALTCQFPGRVHYLLGNHEVAQALDRPVGKGDELHNSLFRQGVEAAYRSRATEVYAAYLRLWATAPLVLRTSNRLFISHSLPARKWSASFDLACLEKDVTEPETLQPGGSGHALLWGRDTQADHVAWFLARVDADLLVTGHTPCDHGFEVPNERQVILDCTGTPASYALIPTDRSLTHSGLLSCVHSL